MIKNFKHIWVLEGAANPLGLYFISSFPSGIHIVIDGSPKKKNDKNFMILTSSKLQLDFFNKTYLRLWAGMSQYFNRTINTCEASHSKLKD